MTWFKVDDGFSDHPKVRSIPRKQRAAAVGLWTLAGSWSSRHLTEGVIPGYMIEDLGCTKAQADALVASTLWHRGGHDCHECPPSPGGYVFHGWTERNPSRVQVEREREASAERQRRARDKRRTQGSPEPHVDATQASREPHAEDTRASREPRIGEQPRDRTAPDLPLRDDVTDMSRRDASVVSQRPDPTRPDPTKKTPAATRPHAAACAPRGEVALFDPPAALVIVEAASEVTAQTLVAEWLDHCAKRPPDTVIGQTSKAIRKMLDEGQDPADIRAGLAEWKRKGLHPSALPSVVNELMNRGPRHNPGQDIDWDAAMQRARAAEATA